MISVQLTLTHLSGLKQNEREVFSSFPISIGRAPNSNVRLAANDTRASTRHAEVIQDGKNLILKDLKSTNGTYVSGRRIDQVKLVNGDVVEFGIGGPKLRFDFIAQEVPITVKDSPLVEPFIPPPPKSVPVRLKEASNPRIAPLAISPTMGDVITSSEKPTPDYISNSKNSTSRMLIEEREFPFRNRFKYVLFALGGLLLIASIVLLVKQILIWTVPSGLIGLFLVIMGWSCSRINITASAEGIHYQGILRSIAIRWDEVTELKAFRSRTRLLTDLVYVVRSRNNSTIVFSIEDYQDGLELANLIARRSRLAW
ncbi:MAG: FHA domain-containing protein [Acidobacteria bacterium]|nr:FHA domain-containing protein [Acidobacteriota bacterium]